MAKYEYMGESARQAAHANGITDVAFYQRMHRGWTVGRAIKTPMTTCPPKFQWVITNENKTFGSASALAEYLGVTKNMVIGREYRHGSPFMIGKYIIEKRYLF